MEIKTYKPEEYRSCPVYFRNWGWHFEYLTVVKGELYTAHLSVRPTPYRRLFHWLGWIKNPYTDEQEKKILQQLRLMAQSTVDYIRNKGLVRS